MIKLYTLADHLGEDYRVLVPVETPEGRVDGQVEVSFQLPLHHLYQIVPREVLVHSQVLLHHNPIHL